MDISYYKKYEPIFGSWHIVRELGEGASGKVFEIEREDFGYTYKAAMKVVSIPTSRAEVETALDDGMDVDSVTTYFRGFVSELVGEFRIMSQLKGESNIVSYEDHMVVPHENGIGWDIFIRMELLTPMLKYCRSNSLERDEVIRLGKELCRALELCGKHNIIHRDIKPENIFVSENGKFKLGDFGVAKTVEKTMGGLSKKGTYTYMAPEVYKGEKYGPSVDIYSLGLVLYRYLNNNRTPFLPEYPQPITYSDREKALTRRMSGEDIPAPKNADPKLAAIILKACAYEPKERYASATEMLSALSELSAEPAPAAVKAVREMPEYGKTELHAMADAADRIGQASSDEDATVGIFSTKTEPVENKTAVFFSETNYNVTAIEEKTAPVTQIDEEKTELIPKPPKKPEKKESRDIPPEKPKKTAKKRKMLLPIILCLTLVAAAGFILFKPNNQIGVTWKYSSGVLTIKGNGEMEDYSSVTPPWNAYIKEITSVVIKNGVKSIGSRAFYDCSSLKSVTIPDSVTLIGDYAFYRCSSLTRVTIPDSVKSIGSCAFSFCGSLKSVTIPNSLTSIGSDAFYNCSNLTSVSIPDSVKRIGSSAFYYCNSLTDVYYAGSESQWNSISIGAYNDALTNAAIHYNAQ